MVSTSHGPAHTAVAHTGPPGFRMAVLGMAAVMSQAFLLREAMTTLGGSEIAWGVLLFLWLAGAGIGARAGGATARTSHHDRWGPLAVAVGAVAGAALLRAAPWLLVDVGGEVAGGPEAILLWVLAVLPASTAVGFSFARFAGAIKGASKSYALESAGATLGGLLFTFVLAPFGSPVIAGATLGIGLIAGFAPERKLSAIVAVVMTCAIGVAAGPLIGKATWAAGRHAQPLAHDVETRHQRIEIAGGSPSPIYIDGRFAGTQPADPYLVLPKSRLLLLLHPSPISIAVVGGLADGRVTGLLEDPVEHLTVLEEDRGLVETLRSQTSQEMRRFLADPRIDVQYRDPVHAVRRLSDLDLVVLLDGPPSTLRANRTRTREFFEICRASLAPGGLLIVDGHAGGNYLGGAAGRMLSLQFHTLKSVFSHVVAIAGDPVFFVAGIGETGPDLGQATLELRWRQRTDDPEDTLGLVLPTLLQPELSAAVTDDLASSPSGAANTIDRPVLMLPSAALCEARGFRPLLSGLAVLTEDVRWVAAIPLLLAAAWMLLTPFVGNPNRPRTAPAAVLGFASMTWWLVLMAGWQGARGSVYSEVGLLTALFMAGLTLGAVATARARNPVRLPGLFLAGAAFSGIIAAGLFRVLSVAVIPALLLMGGAITGAAFAGVASIAGGRGSQRGIASAFAGDELGGAAAALAVGVVGLPWLGTTAIAAITGFFCLAVIPATWRAGTRRS